MKTEIFKIDDVEKQLDEMIEEIKDQYEEESNNL